MQRRSLRCPATTLARIGEDQSRISQLLSFREFAMNHVKTIAVGAAAAGALGLAALGIGTAAANAAPVPGTQWAQDWGPWQDPDHHWDHWDGPWGGAGWEPPPPPPPYYGYRDYDQGPPCISGPLGFIRLCA